MSEDRATDLSFVQTGELIAELVQRHEQGLLIMERQAEKEPDSIERTLRYWGNSTWCIGASHILMEEMINRTRGLYSGGAG